MFKIRAIRSSSAADAAAAEPEPKKEPRLKTFEIYRWNPEKPNEKPFLQKYKIDLNECTYIEFKTSLLASIIK